MPTAALTYAQTWRLTFSVSGLCGGSATDDEVVSAFLEFVRRTASTQKPGNLYSEQEVLSLGWGVFDPPAQAVSLQDARALLVTQLNGWLKAVGYQVSPGGEYNIHTAYALQSWSGAYGYTLSWQALSDLRRAAGQ